MELKTEALKKFTFFFLLAKKEKRIAEVEEINREKKKQNEKK